MRTTTPAFPSGLLFRSPSEIVPWDVVEFEETGETRRVVGDCQVCFRAAERYGTGVVSPTGLAHIAVFETTICGHDTTTDRWWWPL